MDTWVADYGTAYNVDVADEGEDEVSPVEDGDSLELHDPVPAAAPLTDAIAFVDGVRRRRFGAANQPLTRRPPPRPPRSTV